MSMHIWARTTILPLDLEDGHVPLGGPYYEVVEYFPDRGGQDWYESRGRFATAEAAQALAPGLEPEPSGAWHAYRNEKGNH